jgi:hypothetical protein
VLYILLWRLTHEFSISINVFQTKIRFQNVTKKLYNLCHFLFKVRCFQVHLSLVYTFFKTYWSTLKIHYKLRFESPFQAFLLKNSGKCQNNASFYWGFYKGAAEGMWLAGGAMDLRLKTTDVSTSDYPEFNWLRYFNNETNWISFAAGKRGHSKSFHNDIFSILALPPGALLLIFFKNGFSKGKSPMCFVVSRNRISSYNAANV